MMPYISNTSKLGKETVDLISHDFLARRRVYLFSTVNDEAALEVVAQLDYLDSNGSGDITLYINSPGGSVTSGFAIVDAMRRCQSDVRTVCTGMAASMGAFILSCGTKGKRFVSPLSEIMIHQPLGGAQGQASDIELEAAHIAYTKRKLYELMAANTGKSFEAITQDCDRNYYLDANKAVAYGLVDHILTDNIC